MPTVNLGSSIMKIDPPSLTFLRAIQRAITTFTYSHSMQSVICARTRTRIRETAFGNPPISKFLAQLRSGAGTCYVPAFLQVEELAETTPLPDRGVLEPSLIPTTSAYGDNRGKGVVENPSCRVLKGRITGHILHLACSPDAGTEHREQCVRSVWMSTESRHFAYREEDSLTHQTRQDSCLRLR